MECIPIESPSVDFQKSSCYLVPLHLRESKDTQHARVTVAGREGNRFGENLNLGCLESYSFRE